MGNAGYVALAVVLTAVITVALMPVLGNVPVIDRFVPRVTVWSTSTVTRAETVTSTSTATSVVTQRFTETATVTSVRTTTATSTAWRTSTETTTRTLTKTETSTITETKTVTRTVPLHDYWEGSDAGRVLGLIEHANKSVVAVITLGSFLTWNDVAYEWLVKYASALINDSHRGIRVVVLVRTDTICRIGNKTLKTDIINLINKLNQTIPVRTNNDWGNDEGLTVPYGSFWFITKTYIDGKYLTGTTIDLIKHGYHVYVIRHDWGQNWMPKLIDMILHGNPIWRGCG